MRTFAFTVDDVALENWCSPAELEKLLLFLEEQRVRCTFFVVPVVESTGRPFDSLDPAYLRLLQEALRQGHELAQHGLTHNRFETGIPPQMVLDLPHEGPSREFVRNHQSELLREHTVEKIRRKLSDGRWILEDRLGCEIVGFRAPALQSCVNFFAALDQENYRYDSSVALQPTGWDYICGKLDARRRRISLESYCEAAQVGGSCRELPLTTDYAWELTETRFAATRQLAREDAAELGKIGKALVFVSHVAPIFRGENNCGIRLLRDFFAHLKDQGATAKTLKELC